MMRPQQETDGTKTGSLKKVTRLGAGLEKAVS